MVLTLVSSIARQQNASMSESSGLGSLIREARLRRGWTQVQLGEAVEVAPSYISQIETGARKWPQELIAPLAKALGLSQVDMAVSAGLIDPPDQAGPQVEDDPRLTEFIRRAREHPIPDQWWGTIFGIAENARIDALKLADKH